MNMVAMVVIVTAGAGTLAAEITAPRVRSVTVCMKNITDVRQKFASEMASGILSEIGISLSWRRDQACFESPNSIQVSFASEVQEKSNHLALAHALAFEGSHILVYFERVKLLVPSTEVYKLLAYVLVHEITHILQSSDAHSTAGIMKAHWSDEDFLLIRKKALFFIPFDAEMIKLGMAKHQSDTALIAAQ